MTDLIYNWKFVPFDSLERFFSDILLCSYFLKNLSVIKPTYSFNSNFYVRDSASMQL